MKMALSELTIDGIDINRDLLAEILSDEQFVSGEYTTDFMAEFEEKTRRQEEVKDMDLFAFRKPKNELESDEGESKNVPFVPEEMWIKCPKCNTMLLTTDMEENLHVCTKCNHHFRMNGRDRVEMLADKDTFVEFDADLSSHNILDFPGYDEKLEKARKTGARSLLSAASVK